MESDTGGTDSNKCQKLKSLPPVGGDSMMNWMAKLILTERKREKQRWARGGHRLTGCGTERYIFIITTHLACRPATDTDANGQQMTTTISVTQHTYTVGRSGIVCCFGTLANGKQLYVAML